jgi:hypothetical protein
MLHPGNCYCQGPPSTIFATVFNPDAGNLCFMTYADILGMDLWLCTEYTPASQSHAIFSLAWLITVWRLPVFITDPSKRMLRRCNVISARRDSAAGTGFVHFKTRLNR